ncbi:MAG: hypothetical protein GTO63_24030 [Anaerolineae bacterium]|nr:hypothetical protein [Anaerolineae bacterium]NIN97791.1 hypothetical protein [Anaerolineae bacterium]NIQ80787.1 hypothetical protein [Anaerolineae bacterium]
MNRMFNTESAAKLSEVHGQTVLAAHAPPRHPRTTPLLANTANQHGSALLVAHSRTSVPFSLYFYTMPDKPMPP